ncbi:hypothetical protein [Demequina sp. NBRC 110051]|uniref:hypothetical protein n=1 Tax=Demequina sp. NBRC 110051 TaxID=1570340 RepID=UPI0009FD0F7B|nr:hypothetical protein [Demequina sp. NBRC 110051]
MTDSVARMVDIDVAADCGNVPKQAFVRDMLVAGVRGDDDGVQAALEPDATVRPAGAEPSPDHAASRLVEAMTPPGLSRIRLDTVISHGKVVVAAGALVCEGEQHEFCHVVTFSGHGKTARVAHITLYGAWA